MVIYILLIILAIVVIAKLVILISMVCIVRQAEAVIVERLGKYHRTLKPGFNLLVPFLESPRKIMWNTEETFRGSVQRQTVEVWRIDLRETVDDFPRQNVITKDNVQIEINALLYYQIFDPKAAIYEVANLPNALEKLTQTTLRNVFGSLDLDETFVSRDAINEKLRNILDEATDRWGIKVNRVELQEINPPEDIRIAMEKQMRAERDRRATILTSEGDKRAAILQAEGIQESQILKAKGEAEAKLLQADAEAQARLKIAQAEAQAIEMIQRVLPNENPTQYMIANQYIKMLPELTKGKDDKLVVIPYEAASLLGSVATIKKIFNP